MAMMSCLLRPVHPLIATRAIKPTIRIVFINIHWSDKAQLTWTATGKTLKPNHCLDCWWQVWKGCGNVLLPNRQDSLCLHRLAFPIREASDAFQILVDGAR
jgi:hypothetical protein